jgi:cold shock CspA family protein
MMQNPMTGKIERIVEEKGLGFIAGEDGQDYVFHRSALPKGEPFDQLLLGAAVTFDTVHEPKGLRAEAVRIVKSGA